MNASLKLNNGVELNFDKFQSIINQMQAKIRENIVYLNYGGCGRFAFLTHRELKRYGIESEMVILHCEGIEERKSTLDRILNGREPIYAETKFLSFNHCCIKVGSLNFDFDGYNSEVIANSAEYGDAPQGTYTEEEMKIALDYAYWNTMYKTSQNDLLEKIIQESLQVLEN